MTRSILPILQKPDYGQPCNHCGRCCMAEPCGFAKAVGANEAPCRFIEQRGDEFYCGLIRIAPPELQPFMAFRLGMGMGCDSDMRLSEREADA